jgi:hypothetical protein
VQREPAESDLRPWPAELRTELAANPEVQIVDDVLAWPSSIEMKPASAPAWSWLLWGLAALIALELATIGWFAWRKHSVRSIPAAAS